ncbi:MAG: PEP-CTERM sorting domain-containing protein [Fimbriimonadaceae bacterium]
MKKALLMVVVAVAAPLVHADVLLDDFSSGAYSVSVSGLNTDYNEQAGTMLGGHRTTAFETVVNAFSFSALMSIDPSLASGGSQPGLYDSAQVGVATSTTLLYGVDYVSGGYVDNYLHADWSSNGTNAFNFHFLQNDQPLGYSVEVVSNNGAVTSLASGTIAAAGSPFDYSVAFGSLSSPITLTDVDKLIVSFGGSAGGDYALGNISLVTAAPEPASTALLVAGVIGLLARRRHGRA